MGETNRGRPTIHPFENINYTHLLLLASYDLTQKEIHDRLDNEKSDISTIQKIKKLENYDLVIKEKKGGKNNRKKIFLNYSKIVSHLSEYFYEFQDGVFRELEEELDYWNDYKRNFKKIEHGENSEFYEHFIERTIQKTEMGLDYLKDSWWETEHFYYYLNTTWFFRYLKILFRLHSSNPYYTEKEFGEIIGEFSRFLIAEYEGVKEYVEEMTLGKVPSFLEKFPIEESNPEKEESINEYIEGKKNTICALGHLKNVMEHQPSHQHRYSALWVLEATTDL